MTTIKSGPTRSGSPYSFHGGDVNAVLRLVYSLVDDENTQVSLLAAALTVACRSYDVPQHEVVEAVMYYYDVAPVLVPVDDSGLS